MFGASIIIIMRKTAKAIDEILSSLFVIIFDFDWWVGQEARNCDG